MERMTVDCGGCTKNSLTEAEQEESPARTGLHSPHYNQLKALAEAVEISAEERRSMAAGNGGQPNTDWVEAMMGFPPGWTVLEPDGQTEPGKREYPE